ncbi:ECU10_0445 [Encephalitozoon cuniculi GB-M1]|uniref:ECU10_0445 protein n=1 Tax=Encephalitozoon cuniculi (strain GB-M1) TaxID=284813 RepID=I7KFZ3_ENCCU|nr:uncharacterized protein ECU10_0445 [Encephalitozoon cuniculi GB-M1]CCI73988.1 ECU10_0445 [Encephalitozoon cuniculi GB-M1]
MFSWDEEGLPFGDMGCSFHYRNDDCKEKPYDLPPLYVSSLTCFPSLKILKMVVINGNGPEGGRNPVYWVEIPKGNLFQYPPA